MNKKLISAIDRLFLFMENHELGINLVSRIMEIASWFINGEKTRIENHQGYWFRQQKNGFMPIGTRIRPRIQELRSWSSPMQEDHYQMRSAWWFRKYTPKEGDFIIDIGAGMGEDAHVFSQAVGPSGRVLAIEAHPSTFKALSLFVTLNNIQNIQAENLAVSDTNDTLWISSLPDENWQCNSIVIHNELENGAKIKALRLDDIPDLADRNRIDFMKINIEGAEIMALNGAPHILSKTNSICVCCHDFLGSSTQTKKEVCSILLKAGFTLSFTSPDSPPYEQDFVYGTRNELNKSHNTDFPK